LHGPKQVELRYVRFVKRPSDAAHLETVAMKSSRLSPRRRLRTAPIFLAFLAVAAAGGLLDAPRAAGQPPESAHVVPATPATPSPPDSSQQNPPAQQTPSQPPQTPNQPPQANQPPSPPNPPAQAPSQAPQAPATPPAQAPNQAPQAPAAATQQPGPRQPAQQAPQGPAAGSSGAPATAVAPPAPAPRRSVAAPPPQALAAGTAGPLFGEQIDVRVVNVEAVVTDKSGNRVPNLKPSEFVLKVDGKPIKIEYFSEVRGGQAIVQEAGAAETVPGLPDLAPGAPVGTSYLVFIDDYFSIAPDRNLVLRSLKEELARLGPEDRMALVTYDGRHVELLSSWSSSQRDLARAIDREMGNMAHGLERQAELRNFRSSEGPNSNPNGASLTQQIHGNFASTTLNINEEGYVAELGGQIESVVHAAVGTLRGFATPPGRKVMLLLSGGWPFSPADYAINDITRPITQSGLPSGEKLLRPLVETANRLGYTLYPVDVPGIETAAADASIMQSMSANNQFGLREQEHEGTLVYLAKETGGKALLNSLRIGAVEHVEADTRSYYWLGFTPSWQGNDKRHTIQLAMTRQGLSVRTRDSFLDRSRKAETSMMVESAMLFGNSPGAPQMGVQLGQPVKLSRSQMEVPVTLAIPTDSFTTVPLNGKFAAELELRVAAQNERGDPSEIPVIPLQLLGDRQPVPGPGHFVRFQTKLKLQRTALHLVFAIFDPLSNKITMAEADVKPE
jgi:VWFA-related protein